MEKRKPPAAGKGRPLGAKNKANRELKELAQQYTDEAVLTLAEIMRNDEAPAVARVHCAEALLAYGHGKPRQQHVHTGQDGGPIEMSVEHRRAAARAVIDAAFAEHERREESEDGDEEKG